MLLHVLFPSFHISFLLSILLPHSLLISSGLFNLITSEIEIASLLLVLENGSLRPSRQDSARSAACLPACVQESSLTLVLCIFPPPVKVSNPTAQIGSKVHGPVRANTMIGL